MALVTVSEKSKALVITLNDPDSLNAMGEGMAKEFAAAICELSPKAQNFRAVILTGAGRAFSAGGDLDMLFGKTKLSGEENRRRMHNFYNSFLCIRDLGLPIIAAINGHAIGAGLCLACACDIRIASEKAKLGFTFTKLGLHPGMGATYFLSKVVGESTAAELMLTGKIIEAADAFRLGLVSKLVNESEVINEAIKIVDEIALTGPQATRQLLESIRGDRKNLSDSLAREALCQAVNYASEEFKEGVTATKEKRAPKWPG